MNLGKSHFYLFIICIAGICSCKNDEMQTSLVITTLDDSDNAVAGADVDLYYSVEDWRAETDPVFQTMQSDQDGRVSFMIIDTGVYYIDVQKGITNNWEDGVVKQVIEGFQNTTRIFVNENGSGNLSSALGKQWILNTFKTNGEDSFNFLEDCVKDDILTFFKGPKSGAFEISRGSLKCSIFEENKIVGLWDLISDDTGLRIQLGLDIINWNIDTLNAEKLSVSYIEDGNIQNAGYIPLQ